MKNSSLPLWDAKAVWVRVRPVLTYSLLAALLYFALRNAPLTEIWVTLQKLQLWQIPVLFGLNIVIYFFITLRWWLIIRAEKKVVRFFPLFAARIAAFGVSYFTPGPQVGGEPVQVLYLQRNYGLTYVRAASTVVVDKLLEFLAGFVLLGFGLTAIFQAGIFPTSGSGSLAALSGLVLLMLFPPVHIALMFRGIYPVSAVLRKFSNNKFARFVAASERMAGTFCRRHPASLVTAIFASLFAALGMVVEFFFITHFLGIELSFWQTLSAWTAGWLSFLLPLPGGLGALEASQVFALGAWRLGGFCHRRDPAHPRPRFVDWRRRLADRGTRC